MKHSQLARKTPLATRKPMKQRRKRKASTDARWRSPEYLDWVRNRPCVFCGLGPCDAHHVIGLGWDLSGMGLTAPDSFVMALCRYHHAEVHKQPGLQSQQPDWLRWTISQGIKEFSGEIREELIRAWKTIEEKESVG